MKNIIIEMRRAVEETIAKYQGTQMEDKLDFEKGYVAALRKLETLAPDFNCGRVF